MTEPNVIWVKFNDGAVTSIEYEGDWVQKYSTFDAFCANFQRGWGNSADEDAKFWAVSDSTATPPAETEWKEVA